MRTALRALIVAATTAGALSLPGPAQAATITSLDCVTSSSHSLTCSVTGLAMNPFTIRWYRDGATISNWNDKWTVTFFCRPAPVEIEVRVVLTDANGEAESTTSGACGTS
jgi:hypothetical protein